MLNRYLEGKNGRAIILLHAYTSSNVDVTLIGTALNQAGYTVYMPTLCGHGEANMYPIIQHNVEDFRKDVQQFIAYLKQKGYEQIAIFGLSMGGMLSIDALTKKDSTLIGGGSFNSPVPLVDYDKVYRLFMVFAERLYNKSFGDKATYIKELSQGAKKQLESISQLTYEVYGALNNIEVPVFIAQSGKDELIPNTTGEALARGIHFAPVEYHYFPEATHAITVGPYRGELTQQLLQFIDTLEWRF